MQVLLLSSSQHLQWPIAFPFQLGSCLYLPDAAEKPRIRVVMRQYVRWVSEAFEGFLAVGRNLWKESCRSSVVVVAVGRICLLSLVGMVEMGIGRRGRRLLGEMSRDRVVVGEVNHRTVGGYLVAGLLGIQGAVVV